MFIELTSEKNYLRQIKNIGLIELNQENIGENREAEKCRNYRVAGMIEILLTDIRSCNVVFMCPQQQCVQLNARFNSIACVIFTVILLCSLNTDSRIKVDK